MNTTIPTDLRTAPKQSEEVAERPQTPTTPLAPTTPTEPSPFASPEPKYEEPLYTEINIPLPPLPKLKAGLTSPKSRPRSHSLSSFRPFHRRGSSADSTGKAEEAWPRIKKEVKSKEVAAAMNLTNRHRRSGTIDALAVVPAVLVLSAELFTPGEEGKKKKKSAVKWEDGMI